MAVRLHEDLESAPDESVAQPTLAEIEARYAVRDPVRVRPFLARRSELSALLLAFSEQAAHYFPESAERRLRLMPAYEDEPESLLLSIVTPLQPEHAMSQLRRLDEEWWLDISSAPGSQDLVIDVLPLPA